MATKVVVAVAPVRAAASAVASAVVQDRAPVPSRGSGASIVRVRAAASVRQVAATASVVVAIPAAIRATALRAAARHAAAAAVAEAPQAHSGVRAANPRRHVRTVWRSVRNSRR